MAKLNVNLYLGNSQERCCVYFAAFATMKKVVHNNLEATRENTLPLFKSLASMFNVSGLTLAINVSYTEQTL